MRNGPDRRYTAVPNNPEFLLLQATVKSRHFPLLGVGLKLASVVLFSGMAVCVKLLGREIPPGQSIFVRGIISVLVLALIAWRTDQLHLLRTRNWRSHALRSLSGVAEAG